MSDITVLVLVEPIEEVVELPCLRVARHADPFRAEQYAEQLLTVAFRLSEVKIVVGDVREPDTVSSQPGGANGWRVLLLAVSTFVN
jgi:hypothetical protein